MFINNKQEIDITVQKKKQEINSVTCEKNVTIIPLQTE